MQTIPELFKSMASEYAGNVLVHEKVNGVYKGFTYREIEEDVKTLAVGFYELGLRKGDRVALLAEGRKDWLVAELALFYIGVIDVPLSVKLIEPKELSFRINHSGCRMVIVSDSQLPKVREIEKEIKEVEKIIVMDDVKAGGKEILLSEVIKTGSENFERSSKAVDKITAELKGDDIANISYTSGTTADPKGIMLTHRNYTANTEQGNSLFDITPDFRTLLILPWDHSFAHTVGLYTIISNGASLAVVEKGKTAMETLKNIPKNIKEIKPYFLLSVPALAKNFRKNIEAGIKKQGDKAEKLFNLALKTAYAYNKLGYNKGTGGTFVLKPLLKLFDKILFSKVREGFGGELRYFVGGGALLDIELQKFFYAIGIPMYQGYGLSEAAPVISSNSPKAHKMGSSGKLVATLELKILDDDGNELPVGEKGEIVVKGENVMKGYWKNEKATAETLKNGWLHTGDMGYMDSDGFLYVLGRFKSLLIGHDGEKFSPEGIEEALTDQSKYIEQVVLHNNQDPYTVGLIVPNIQALREYVKEHGKDIRTEEGIELALKKIRSEVDEYMPGGKYEGMFPSRWLPAAIGITDESFNENNGLMNATMKVIRGKVTERFSDLLDYLYTADGKKIVNEKNVANMKKWVS
jgi:long-chain acyl-CoA synthetase